MNIYNAIMTAADHIESDPGSFNFSRSRVPAACGSPGCALGWIGFFLGTTGIHACDVAIEIGVDCTLNPNRKPEGNFYERVDALVGSEWIFNAAKCVKGLRLYAAKYHAPKRTGLPETVRDIFKSRTTV